MTKTTPKIPAVIDKQISEEEIILEAIMVLKNNGYKVLKPQFVEV